MAEREKLMESAMAAMRAAGRLPERQVLVGLPDDMLREIAASHGGPVIAG